MPVDWICFEVKLSADLCNQTLLCEIILKIQDDKIVTLRVKLVRAQRRKKLTLGKLAFLKRRNCEEMF